MEGAKRYTIDYSFGGKSSPSVSFAGIVVLAFAVGLIALLTSPYWLGFLQLEDFLVQRKCLQYNAPADQVVYESYPEAAQLLVGQGKGYHLAENRAATYTPRCWEEFGSNSASENVLLFLHLLKNKSGAHLVAVELRRNSSGFVLGTRIYNYNGLTFSRPSDFFSKLPIGSPQSKALRFYAGQVDPADASRFLIRYTLDGKDSTFLGQLSERGDTVTFQFPAIAETR
jgi:hypothetical protein